MTGRRQSGTFDPATLERLYESGNCEVVSRSFIGVLEYFNSEGCVEISPKNRGLIDMVVGTLLSFLTRDGFRIPDAAAERLIGLMPVISNLAFVSSFGTSDRQLEKLELRPENLVKILMLCSPRSEVKIDRERLFEMHPRLASIWYAAWFYSVPGPASKTVHENMQAHQAFVPERYELFGLPAVAPFFRSTYVDCETERPLKEKLNSLVRQTFSRAAVRNKPKPGKIAVVTAKWYPANVVYRSVYPFVAALAQDYELSLIHIDGGGPGPDASLFGEVKRLRMFGRSADLSAIRQTDCQVAYFPDVGLVPETIFLSNLRLAPVQVSGYGHPVSTFGSQIDYFIGGTDVEVPERAGENYSERLVLIPGMGVFPVFPQYERRRPGKDTDAILINCPWSEQKLNFPLLSALREIIDRSERPVAFQCLGGLRKPNMAFSFRQDLASVLGDGYVPDLGYMQQDQYMETMEKGDFSLDSFPFGGYNTIVDSLHLGKPVIAWEGDKFYNRASAAVVRRVGLGELVARSRDEYVAKALRLVADEEYRQELSSRLEGIDLKSSLCADDEAAYFKDAITFLIENHETLRRDGARGPIRIGG